MQEEHINPAPDENPQKTSSGTNKFLIPFLVTLLILVGAGVYWFITQRTSKEVSVVTETVSPTPTETETPSGSPTASPKPTKSPKPTPSPTSTPSPTPVSTTKTITSSTSIDGFRSSNGGGNNSVEIRAGRNSNLVTRGFVSFDLGVIPSGVTVEKATLRLYQTSVIGDPYGVGGSIKVDQLDYGSTLENADYSAPSISSSFATLTSNATVEWKDVDVTDQVKNDLSSGRSRSQYRIHFAIESIGGTVTGDFAYFESDDNSVGTGNIPQLVIKYH